MRRPAPIVALGLIAAATACSTQPPTTGEPPSPTYSREMIRAVEVFGVHLGMEAGAACHVLKEAGFTRGWWNNTDVDCSVFPEDDADDAYFGRGPRAETPFGKLGSISLQYRVERGVRRVGRISIYTDEKAQRDRLVAASRTEWGEPTASQAWGALNYAESAAQADFDNRASYGSCQYLPCMSAEEAAQCILVIKRFATATLEVTVFDWGRYIYLRDERRVDHRELLEELALIRDGRSYHGCPLHGIH